MTIDWTVWGLPQPVTEFRFDSVRKYRWDYAWLEQKVALEVQGGVWNRGKHGRPLGIIADQAKSNFGQIRGWIVLACQPSDITKGSAATIVLEALKSRMTATTPSRNYGADQGTTRPDRPAFSPKEK